MARVIRETSSLDHALTLSILAPVRSGSVPRPLPPSVAVLAAASLVVLWALWAAYFNTAQFGDNVEQFSWAQSLELGYHKHPPLPSWVLGAVVRCFGPSIYWAYALSTLCLLGTAAFTWAIGRQLVGDRVAAAAIVLWGLNLSFSQRVQLYNHNTMLVLCISATIWCAMRAASRRGPGWWIATGIAAGAALLSKYQAALPLIGLLLALGLAGQLRRPDQWRGVAIALAATLLVFAPHAFWVAHHDFTTLRYASDAIEESTVRQRFGFIVSFVANQLRMGFPALLAIALCLGWGRRRATGAGPTRGPVARADFRVWMFGLIGATLIVMALMALFGSVSLRNHWGVQALQFSSVWIAYHWDRHRAIDLGRLMLVALAVQAVSLGYYAYEHSDSRAALLSNRRMDTMYPAKRLALAGVAHWSSQTSCPMHYVAGTVFDAGLVSLYSGGEVEVFDTATATPWVKPEALLKSGALYVLDEQDAVPEGVTHVVKFPLVEGNVRDLPAKELRLGILMPQLPCH